jgi:orotidine-5'-phosphate decarboxylase
MTRLADPRLIVALDLPTVAEAKALTDQIGDAACFYKIGLQLFATGGMGLAAELKAQGKQVFLDWKLHDIGATVEKAAAALAGSGADFLTVHGEPQVMAAAVKGRGGSSLKILAVTVMTSLTDQDLTEMGYGMGAKALVERRIGQALDLGCDGVVASALEAELARTLAIKAGRPEFLVVTPGIRPADAALDDQARVATPADALRSGASHIVVGRPVNAAKDPRAAALAIATEIAAVA